MKIVEKMARAHANYVHGGSYDYDADYSQDEKDDHCDGMIAALTATGLTEQQLEGLANGTMVCVPRLTEAMGDALEFLQDNNGISADDARLDRWANDGEVDTLNKLFDEGFAYQSGPGFSGDDFQIFITDAGRAMLAAKEG